MGIRRAFALIITFIFLCCPCFAIKIGLQTHVNRTFLGASTKAEVINCDTNKLIFVMEKMKGYEVFQPMGFDAFGLPAENYAIKTGVHPKDSTEQNIANMEETLKESCYSTLYEKYPNGQFSADALFNVFISKYLHKKYYDIKT